MKKLSKKKVKERRKVGIVKAYISRASAIKKLQVTLADFRRLCILKGIYPVEPKNKSKLTGANTKRKTYFFAKDIQMLMNEPLMFKFWEFKVFMKRLTRAKGRHDLEKFNQVNENKPIYKLDAVVKERYPRFVDALRDCDDALSMCFLFAMFPKGRGRPDDLIDLSRKLTVEFMHYVINSRTLRKVFISIKGYYYQAEIMGQTITWIVPHQFVIDRVSDVDLNVMKTFTEFYVTLLGFINHKLYKTINAVYPPQIVADNLKDLVKVRGAMDKTVKKSKKRKREDADDEEREEKEDSRDALIAALNKKIRIMENKSVINAEKDDQQIDTFEDPDETDKKKDLTVQQVMALEKLFSNLKFYLNREVPRESLTFVLRSFGGEVSWDRNLFPGATFDESDPTITHHIIDRSSVAERHLNRVYIQPQWVYDSINARTLLPTAEYLIGATLPPHLSPFISEKRVESVPVVQQKKQNINKSTSQSRMIVKKGKLTVEDKEEVAKKEDAEARKMGIMMIPKKKKRLFDKITKTKRERANKTEKLRAKRRIVEAVAQRKKVKK